MEAPAIENIYIEIADDPSDSMKKDIKEQGDIF